MGDVNQADWADVKTIPARGRSTTATTTQGGTTGGGTATTTKPTTTTRAESSQSTTGMMPGVSTQRAMLLHHPPNLAVNGSNGNDAMMSIAVTVVAVLVAGWLLLLYGRRQQQRQQQQEVVDPNSPDYKQWVREQRLLMLQQQQTSKTTESTATTTTTTTTTSAISAATSATTTADCDDKHDDTVAMDVATGTSGSSSTNEIAATTSSVSVVKSSVAPSSPVTAARSSSSAVQNSSPTRKKKKQLSDSSKDNNLSSSSVAARKTVSLGNTSNNSGQRRQQQHHSDPNNSPEWVRQRRLINLQQQQQNSKTETTTTPTMATESSSAATATAVNAAMDDGMKSADPSPMSLSNGDSPAAHTVTLLLGHASERNSVTSELPLPTVESLDLLSANTTVVPSGDRPSTDSSIEIPITPTKSLESANHGVDKSVVMDSSSSTDTPSTAAAAPPPLPPFAPPIQLLCLCLSHIFGRTVMVEPHEEAGTWGGQEWRKSRSNTKTTTKTLKDTSTTGTASTPLKLVLHPHYPEYSHNDPESDIREPEGPVVDQSWTALVSVLSRLFPSNTTSSSNVPSLRQPPHQHHTWSKALHLVPVRAATTSHTSTARYKDITWLQHVVAFHGRLTDMVRNHHSYPTLVKLYMDDNLRCFSGGSDSSVLGSKKPVCGSTEYQPLAQCLNVFQLWLVHHLVNETRPYLHATAIGKFEMDNDDDDDDDDDNDVGLFSDEYGGTSTGGSYASESTGSVSIALTPLDLLPTLLESSFSSSNSSTIALSNALVTVDFVEDYLRLQAYEIQLFSVPQGVLPNTATATTTTAVAPSSIVKDEGVTIKATSLLKPAPNVPDPAAMDTSARLLLQQCIHRLEKALYTTANKVQFQCSTLTNRLLAVSTLLSLSSSVRTVVPHVLCEDDLRLQKGKRSRTFSLRPLWEAVAYVVPPVGSERATSMNDTNVKTPFYQQLDATDDFPRNAMQPAVSGSSRRNEILAVEEESWKLMNRARTTAQSLLRVAFKYGDKHKVFHWLGDVLREHESLVPLLTAELLETELESSRQFLLGFSSLMVSYCHVSLSKRLDSNGAAAFDLSFICEGFQGHYEVEQVDGTNRLFQGYEHSSSHNVANRPKQFDGATRFFFLTCLCLRVSVRTAFRTEAEFNQKNQHIWSSLEGLAKAENDTHNNRSMIALYKPIVSAMLGWRAYLEDPDFASAVTEISLIQLGWLVALAVCDGEMDLSLVPDWMCLEPARWIASMAHRASHRLKPIQADRAVEYATRLLDLGSSSNGNSKAVRFSFSPIVTTALIGIITSFVQVSVRRATYRAKVQKQRQKNTTVSNSSDDWDVDIYSSFDTNDSGVTVFTNELVRKRLCPTLARTFVDVGIVEGLDVEKDDTFTKQGAKAQIAELISRLWYHPSGKFRESFAMTSDVDLVAFAASAASELTVGLNFGLESLTRLYIHEKQKDGAISRFGNTEAMINHWTQQIVGSLLSARGYLWMLCSISLDDRVASRLGGSVESVENHSFSGIANMLVNVLEAVTSSDGGTKLQLENCDACPTSKHLELGVFEALTNDMKTSLIQDIVRQRIRNRIEFGLDVANLCRAVLSLFARWHMAAAVQDESGKRTSPLLNALARIEDWDQGRANAVFDRLVVKHELVAGNESDNAVAILRSDGHVDHERWELNYIETEVSGERSRLRRSSSKNQSNLASISVQLASCASIKMFLADLECAVADCTSQKCVEVSEIPELENALFSGEISADEMYHNALSEWVVSSEPFASVHRKTFSHYYDKVARSHMSGSGKTLVREARRCNRLLSDPSANSAIYLCFAEERMDLCRAVMTGPVDTPYAHGLFVFDIYFPPSYPFVPPMITFMTTGGGRVRFNPNLYVDGKVCLSLLGVTGASDVSQRWNKDHSTLAQVLLSIQSQILGVAEPYYNEGNGVSPHLRGTREGNAGSQAYTLGIRLATMRYAMIDILRHPPRGFEEVVLRHFAICRQRIAMQSKRWMLEAGVLAQRSHSREDEKTHSRFAQLHADLLSALATSPAASKYPSLAPLQSDVSIVAMMDPNLLRRRAANAAIQRQSVDGETVAEDRKIAAQPRVSGTGPVAQQVAWHGSTDNNNAETPNNTRSTAHPQLGESYNPWASPPEQSTQTRNNVSSSGGTTTRGESSNPGQDSDDELYE